MKLSEVKTYVLGVLRGAFSNKNILDKLGTTSRNKLTYDNAPVNSFDTCYRKEKVLWSGLSNSTLELSDEYDNYDSLIIVASSNTITTMNTQGLYHQNVSTEIPTDRILIDKSGNIGVVTWANYNLSFHIGSDKKTITIDGSIAGGSSKAGYNVILEVKGVNYTPIPDQVKSLEYYDTEERVIGSWMNGKPVYQKVLNVTQTTTGEVVFNHDIQNIDTIICKDATCYMSSTAYSQSNFRSSAWDVGFYWIGPTQFSVFIGSSRGNQLPGNWYIVVNYTKTTDLEDSFSPDLINNPLTKYSTDEKKIGEWIDGKPLYRKTMQINYTGADVQTYNHNVENVDIIFIDAGATYLIGEAGFATSVATPFLAAGMSSGTLVSGYNTIIQGVGREYIQIRGSSKNGGGTACVTFCYTKTTD